MDERVVPVVIVGAGPVGVSTAILLARYGVETLLLERWSGVYPQPRAVHVDEEVFRILARVGVGAAFAEISRPALGLRLLDRDLAVLAEFRRSGTAGGHGYPQANMFDQPDLERLLRAELAVHPQATLRGGSVVTALRQPAGAVPMELDYVELDYTDQVTGAAHGVRAQYVLGCDGANSLVRDRIGARMQHLGFEQSWLVVDVETDADLQQWEGVQQVCDPDRAATFMRIGPTRYRWEFRLRPGESAADYAALAALHPLLRPWTGPVPLADLTLIRSAEYIFRAQLADRWRVGRVFLLGDAAHLTPPFIGQGLGAGLRDAANLSWKLAGVLQGRLPDAALDSYPTERRPHAKALIGLAILVGRVMSGGGRTGVLLRRVIAPRLHLVPGLRARILDSASPPLSRSSLAERSFRHRRLAGALAPNAELRPGVRLDDLAGGFTVLTRMFVPDHVRERIEGGDGVLVQVAPGSPLEVWLRRGRVGLAVLRPDGTVFTAGWDVVAVCARIPGFPVR